LNHGAERIQRQLTIHDFVYVSFKDVLLFKCLDSFFIALKLWVHLKDHVDHGLGLKRLCHCLGFLPALWAVLLLPEPVREASAAESMQTRGQLGRLV